jgi:hypothetical protein
MFLPIIRSTHSRRSRHSVLRWRISIEESSPIQLYSAPTMLSRMRFSRVPTKSDASLRRRNSQHQSTGNSATQQQRNDVSSTVNSSYHSLLDEPQLLTAFVHPTFDDENLIHWISNNTRLSSARSSRNTECNRNRS